MGDSLKPEFFHTTNTLQNHVEPYQDSKDTVLFTNRVTEDDHTTHADTCHTEDHELLRDVGVVAEEDLPNRASASSRKSHSCHMYQSSHINQNHSSHHTYRHHHQHLLPQQLHHAQFRNQFQNHARFRNQFQNHVQLLNQ